MLAVRKGPILPPLQGIFGLSVDEIKRDLADVAAQNATNETDSEESVMSDDVIASHYPVKPRRTLGLQKDTGAQTEQPAMPVPVYTAEVEEAMKFMADAHKNIKDLLTAEEQREVLETTHQAYQLALSSERTHYTTQRDQQEAYLRLLQLVLVGQLKSKMAASQRNAFYLHFHQRLVAAPPKLTNKSGVLLLTVDGWRKAIAAGDLLSTPQGVGEAVLAPLGMRINGAVLPMSPTEMLAGRLAYEQAEGLSLTALAALPIPSQLSYTSQQSSALQDLLGDLQAAVAAPAAEAVDDTDEESDSDEGAPIASAGMDGFKTGTKLTTSCQPWEQRLGRLLLPPSAAPGPLTDSIFNSMQCHAQLVYEPVLGRTTDAVQPLKNEYSKLSGQRAQLIREIASIRKDCATKAVEMSVLRLGMFTRRVTHRNYLSGHNIIISSLPLVQQAKRLNALELLSSAVEEERSSRFRSKGPSAPAAHTGTSSSGPEEELPGPKSSRAKAAALAAEAAALVNNKRNRDESEEDEEAAVEEEKVVKKKPAKRVRK